MYLLCRYKKKVVVNTRALLRRANTFQNVRSLGNVRDGFAHASPAFHALFVNQQRGSERKVGVPLASGVEQAIFADDLRSGIAQHGKLFLQGFVPYQVGVLDVIHADGNQVGVELIEVGLVPRELAQLNNAEWSPITTVKDDEDAVASLVGEMVGLSRLVGQREVGSSDSRRGGDLRLGKFHFPDNRAKSNDHDKKRGDERDYELAAEKWHGSNSLEGVPPHPTQDLLFCATSRMTNQNENQE